MAKLIATAELREFDEYQDVILRIATTRGSFPVVIVDGGSVRSAEAIGRAVLSGFDYLVQSAVYEAARAAGPARCAELGICTCPTACKAVTA